MDSAALDRAVSSEVVKEIVNILMDRVQETSRLCGFEVLMGSVGVQKYNKRKAKRRVEDRKGRGGGKLISQFFRPVSKRDLS